MRGCQPRLSQNAGYHAGKRFVARIVALWRLFAARAVHIAFSSASLVRFSFLLFKLR